MPPEGIFGFQLGAAKFPCAFRIGALFEFIVRIDARANEMEK
jgi:hypothetical protein